MPSVITNYSIGEDGVNVDKNDLTIDDGELRQAQNAIKDTLGGGGGLKSRPGLTNFNASVAAGSVLGGVGMPLINLVTGSQFFYIGRGTK